MRDDRYYNEEFDFEQLIKENVDQFKMYPSSNVWKGIHSSLHTPKPWVLSGVLLLAAAITIYLVAPFTSSKNSIVQESKHTQSDRDHAQEAAVIPLRSKIAASSAQQTIPIQGQPDAHQIVLAPVVPLYPQAASSATQTVMQGPSQAMEVSATSFAADDKQRASTEVLAAVEPEPLVLTPENEFTSSSSVPQPTMVDVLEEESDAGAVVKSIEEPMVYEITKPHVKRWGLQLSISPTMNYRKLTSNRHVALESTVQNVPVALNLQGNINHLVNHTPAVGFEAAAMYLYRINPRWNVKVGGLFNYSRYFIQAYNSGAMDIARISLGGSWNASNTPMTSYSSIRNLGGNSYRGIQNQYFQIAMPIGFEYVLLGQGKLQMGIAGTLQPSFLLNRNSYLITTDYKNYTRQPSLVRQLNMNTAAEAFISYKAAHYKFQLGPQFRYQLYSTYDTQYPIREYLMEYGIKLAVSR